MQEEYRYASPLGVIRVDHPVAGLPAVEPRPRAEGSGHLLVSVCCDCSGRALAAEDYRGPIRCGDCWSLFSRGH